MTFSAIRRQLLFLSQYSFFILKIILSSDFTRFGSEPSNSRIIKVISYCGWYPNTALCIDSLKILFTKAYSDIPRALMAELYAFIDPTFRS